MTLAALRQPRKQRARVILEDRAHLGLREAGGLHGADRIEVGGRKRIIAAERDALDRNAARQPL
jgi:hypothetical protein